MWQIRIRTHKSSLSRPLCDLDCCSELMHSCTTSPCSQLCCFLCYQQTLDRNNFFLFRLSDNSPIILSCLHPFGSRSFVKASCMIASSSGSPCTWIETGSGVHFLSLPPSFFLFSSKGCSREADENNLHAREKKRDRKRGERRRVKTLRREAMMQVRGKTPNTPG